MSDITIIINCCEHHKKKHKVLNFEVGQPKLKEVKTMAENITITNEQKIPVTLTPKTDAGHPASVDGKPTWTVQSGDSTVVVADDGMSASLVSSDTPGDTAILVEADADLGAGVETISAQIVLHVESARAANLGLTVGAAVPK